jgi:pseudouridine-5'-phosphate glycosidase
VALESTVITHGMPWPQNMEMARAVEEIVRAEGAMPATIAVIGGRLRIGLDAAALETLARTRDAMKLSRADLALAQRLKAGDAEAFRGLVRAQHNRLIRIEEQLGSRAVYPGRKAFAQNG